MRKSDLLRVARLCLPKLEASDDAVVQLRDESDLQVTTVCTLWSGMGHIYRLTLPNGQQMIVKHVAAPRKNPSFGDRRKADSYQVEANFYDRLAETLIEKYGLNVPRPLLVERNTGKAKNEVVIAMSFVHSRPTDVSTGQPLESVLTWLATLHASHWTISDEKIQELGLQKTGTYWHLDTRPDEHDSMPISGWEGRLKMAARAIDERLKRDPMQCILHGDTKDANILYTGSLGNDAAKKNNGTVYVCDFQYCGKGPPSKDLAYFFCSTVAPDDERAALEYYLKELSARLPEDAVVPSLQELQDSVDLAYCDFYRFLCGWGMWGSDCVERVKSILYRLDGGKRLASEDDYEEAVRREYG